MLRLLPLDTELAERLRPVLCDRFGDMVLDDRTMAWMIGAFRLGVEHYWANWFGEHFDSESALEDMFDKFGSMSVLLKDTGWNKMCAEDGAPVG